MSEIREEKTMSAKILVTYASRSGTTASVAEAISKTLTEAGLDVDVLAMKDVSELPAYRAVVVGSAIRASKWLPEAQEFVKTHRAALNQKPLAMFTVCITLAMANGANYRYAVEKWVAPVRALVRPLSDGFFAGRLDFSKLPLNFDTIKLRVVVALGIFPKEDRRDWQAIQTWAASLVPLFN
jgi:menaquinone-dependent protoporphyrinogen oxidase